MITMAGVIYTMNGGDIFNGELAFLYFLMFATFFFTGPGKWSLDYLLERGFKRRQVSEQR
jgi:uncharacterized membrane protein YphA (DoxX/SURF4 family)